MICLFAECGKLMRSDQGWHGRHKRCFEREFGVSDLHGSARNVARLVELVHGRTPKVPPGAPWGSSLGRELLLLAGLLQVGPEGADEITAKGRLLVERLGTRLRAEPARAGAEVAP